MGLTAKVFRRPEGIVCIAIFISFIAITIALCFEHVGGYVPCELCYKGRISHYLGIPVMLLSLSWAASPYRKIIHMIILAVIIYLYGQVISVYHAGAEWKFWEGPTSCGSFNLQSGMDATDLLSAIQNTKMVSCTEPALRFLGVSLAGLNAIVSFAVIVLLLVAFFRALSYRIKQHSL
jgi:disulfide bond formation protein DsbB